MKEILSVLFLFIFTLTSFSIPATSFAANQYDYRVIEKSPDASIKAGQSIILWTKIQNTGWENWGIENSANPIRLGTTDPQDSNSIFRTYDKWLSGNRIRANSSSDGIYDFGFYVQAPSYLSSGTYTECFYPVLEHKSWIYGEKVCWNIHVDSNQNNYSAIGQNSSSVNIDLNKGEEKEVEFTVKNTGDETWYKYGAYPIHIATEHPRDRSSDLYNSSWLSYNRPTGLNENIVPPGGLGHFTFTVRAPENTTSKIYNEHFWLVAENLQWFDDPNMILLLTVNIGSHNDDDDNNDKFSNKYSDIDANKDRIDADGNDEAVIEIDLRDRNDDPIKYAWVDLIGKEIDVYDREYDYFDYTIKTNSEGRASYDFTTRTVADYEFTFSYEGEEYNDWEKLGSYDEDEDEKKAFSDKYSDIYINKSYIDSDGDEEARIDISIRDHDNNPIEDERFKLIELEREIDEDDWNDSDYNLETNSRGEADKYFSTRREADYEFTFELDGDRFREWASLKSYEDDSDKDGDFEPDYSYIEVNRNRIKANDSDYALIEIGVNDKNDDPMEDQEVVIYGDRCDLDGRNCRNIDDIIVYTDNSGVAEYKFRYDREAEFELTYEVDGERSRQYVTFEFYEDDNNDNKDFDTGNDYDVPVLSLSYIPVDRYDDVDIDVMKDWKDEDLDKLRDYIDESNKDLMYYLEEGSTYHEYKDSGADPALDYYLADEFEFLDKLPKSDKFTWGNTNDNMIDYFEILENDIDVCDHVDNDGVKEVWIWGYAPESGEPVGWESNMMMGRNIDGNWNYSTYGNVSNSYREKDMPICDNTYTAYTYNYGREVGMALEDHTHQIESVLNYVDGRDDTSSSNWDNLLFWGKFVGSDSSNEIVRPGCGWTHYPPNGEYDYDWHNQDEVWSDCEDWEPDGGYEELVSCETWGGSGCDKYKDDGQNVAFLVWWMQNIPGIDNDVYDGNDKIKNWWDFIGNFDNSIGDQSLTY